jgi:hypothetical protein
MGLLADYLPNMLPQDPSQNSATRQGLLQFGAALLGGKGNFGSILGQGIAAGAGGYNSSLQALQQKALLDAQTKHYTLANDADQAALDQNKAISAGLTNFNSQQAPGAAASLVTDQQPTMPAPLSSTPQASPAPDAGLPLSMFPQSNAAPAQPVAPVSSLPQVGAQQSPAAVDPFADYKSARARAIYLNNNFPGSKQAADALKAVDALKPKIKETKTVTGPDGKTRVLANFFDDPSMQPQILSGVNPDLEKLAFGTDGANHIGQNPFTGEVVSTTKMQATPGELLQSQDQAKSRAQAESHWTAERADANEPGKPNATLAKQIAFYRAPPLGQFNLNKPWGQATMDEVMRLNPDYDAAQYAPRQSALRSFAPGGKDSANIESINTGMNHLVTLRELAQAQKNGDVKAWNKIANAWAAQTGQAAPTNLRIASEMIAPEVVKAVAGVGATGEERSHMAEALTGKGTYAPDQILGGISTAQELFAGRLKEKKRSYERGTKLNDFEDSFLSPASRELLSPAPAKPTVKPTKDLPKKAGNPSDIDYLLNKYGNH